MNFFYSNRLWYLELDRLQIGVLELESSWTPTACLVAYDINMISCFQYYSTHLGLLLHWCISFLSSDLLQYRVQTFQVIPIYGQNCVQCEKIWMPARYSKYNTISLLAFCRQFYLVSSPVSAEAGTNFCHHSRLIKCFLKFQESHFRFGNGILRIPRGTISQLLMQT